MNVLVTAAVCIILVLGNFGKLGCYLPFGENNAEGNMSNRPYYCEGDSLTNSADIKNILRKEKLTEFSGELIRNMSDIPYSGIMPLSEKETLCRTYFSDGGGLFTEGEQAQIPLLLEETAERTGWCIGICTGVRFESGDIVYGNAFGGESGVVLMINKSGAKVIAVGEAAEYIRGERAKNIVRLAERSLRREKTGDVPSQFCGRAVSCRNKGKGSFDFYPPAFVIALIFGTAAGIGTVFFISRRYNLSEPPIVNNYLDVRSIEVYRKEDKLLRSKTVSYQNNLIQQMVRGEGIFRRWGR